MANPMITVATPARKPRAGGITTVANIVTVPNTLLSSDGAEWIADVCGFPLETATDCWGALVSTDPRAEKDYTTGFSYSESGLTRAMYFGVQCFAGSGEDFEARARTGLEQSEDRYIEAVIEDSLFGGDVTLPDANTLVDALAALEQYVDALIDPTATDPVQGGYIAQPTIWVSRGDAVRLAAAYAIYPDREGNLVTANGTPVAASGEWPSGQLAVSGQATVFLTDIFTTRAHDYTLNLEMALAERGFAIAFDCIAPVTITVTP